MAAVLVHLVSQRSAVSLAERRAVDMLALAFALAVPLLATDFARLFPAPALSRRAVCGAGLRACLFAAGGRGEPTAAVAG